MSFIEQVASKYVLASVHSEEVDGILTQRVDKKTGTKKWALVGRKPPHRVLKWFDKKPSKESVSKEERRVQFFKGS